MTTTEFDFLAWRVRLVFDSTTLHFVSSTEPREVSERVYAFDPVPGLGDEVGFIDWTSVRAISWRIVIPEDYVPPTVTKRLTYEDFPYR